MDNEKTKILVLVEGEKTDVKLMSHLLTIYGIDQSHRIVSYKTNIYDLYDHMFAETDPEDVDILQLLKEREPNPEKKRIFDERYSDVLLIFDLDPQDARFSADKITRMIKFFVESSDMGKLYLNYPMVESFYHMKSIPDEDYNSYMATMCELKSHEYKGRVAAENRNHNFGKFAVNKGECDTVIRQNIDKAWAISEAERLVNDVQQFIPDAADILSAQLDKLKTEDALFVLCTCAFYIPDFNPKLIEN